MLHRGVVHYQIHDDTYTEFVSVAYKGIKSGEVAEQRIDVAVVGDVIPVVRLR